VSVRVICDLQRDWNQTETVEPFVEILFDPCVAFIDAERAVTSLPAVTMTEKVSIFSHQGKGGHTVNTSTRKDGNAVVKIESAKTDKKRRSWI
jgi:hypothetical protein